MKTIATLVVLFFCAGSAWAGGSEVGNATDNPALEDGSAWFLGKDRTVQACYELAPKFGADGGKVESAIQFAFAQWQEYLNVRGISPAMIKENFGKEFALRFELSRGCTPAADLAFYFGTSNSEVSLAKAKLENPTAMALRTKFDLASGWGRGFIWLAPDRSIDAERSFPDWSDSLQLKAILLHELGHVLGVKHVRGTIMDEYLSKSLLAKQGLLPQIDQRNQLVFCWRCGPLRYSGRLGYNDKSHADATEKVFKRFVGRAPNGEVRAELSGDTDHMTLSLADKTGKKDLTLSFDYSEHSSAVHSGFDRGERIFKAVWQPAGAEAKVFDFFNGGLVVYGSVRDAATHKLNLVLEVNSHSLASPGPLTLRWVEDGKAHSLFFANPL